MTEIGKPVAPPQDLLGRALFSVARCLAIVGGALVALLVVMVVVSIAGRALFSLPVYGDFELVAMGTAIGVSLFLPHCHLQRGNVIVDIFLARAPEAVKIVCDVVAALLLGTIAGVLTWRTTVGGLVLFDAKEVTMILAIPIWIAFPFVVLSLGLLTVCCAYTATRDAKRLFA